MSLLMLYRIAVLMALVYGVARLVRAYKNRVPMTPEEYAAYRKAREECEEVPF